MFSFLSTHLRAMIEAFCFSMIPVFELRGGIIYAAVRGIPVALAFLVCFLGNILPIPFILLFLRRIFTFLEKFRPTRRIVLALERRARKKRGTIDKYKLFGLFLFVATPLPGTGAWSGALVAVVMDIPLRKALPVIILGVLGAGVIMITLSYLFPSIFSRYFFQV
jgi:uncharacterized membrane protein